MGPPQKHDSATFRHNADKSYPDAATKIAIVPSLFACKVRVDVRSPSNIRCRFIHERGLFFFSCLRILDSSLGDVGKNIFLNKEQSEKPRRGGRFSQDAIDRAFRNRQRFSTMWYRYKDARITMLSGKPPGLHRPCGEAIKVPTFTDSDCQILMPNHLPVGASSLVEEDSSNRKAFWTQADFHNFTYRPGRGERLDARDGQQISLRVSGVVKVLAKSFHSGLVQTVV